MHILIDGNDLWREQGSGIATYARNLAIAAQSLGAETSLLVETAPLPQSDPLLTEIEFYDPRAPKWLIKSRDTARRLHRGVRSILALANPMRGYDIPIAGHVVNASFVDRLRHFNGLCAAPDIFGMARQHFRLTGRRLKLRLPRPVDIVHWTSPLPVELVGAKNIYTFHDLIPLRLPYTTLDDKRYYLRLVRHLVSFADHIVTVSEQSKADILELLDCPTDKISVTYQAVDVAAEIAAGAADGLAERLYRLYNIKAGQYFLFTGAQEPKKNVGRLLSAYFSADCDLPLMMVGPGGWKSESEMRLLAVHRRKRRVKLLDFVTRRQLIDLILGARALVFPSLYEGFGLPVLEAMTLGTAVITSNTDALKEVGGDAVAYVDPYRVDDIRSAIERVAKDDAFVEELQRKGPQQAKRFCPEEYARRLGDLYGRLLADHPSGTS
jgi:glycosyltransferase involved in cell wall biosynthesis